MRRPAAALLLLAGGCAHEAPPVTDRSVWWAPLCAWQDSSLTGPLLTLLGERGIEAGHVGSRGERVRVPCERYAEAADLLRAAPFADRVRVHTLLAAPRPNALLPMLEYGSDASVWSPLASFRRADVAVEKLLAGLNAGQIEGGVISFAWAPESGHLFVPAGSAAAARRLLEAGPYAGALKFQP